MIGRILDKYEILEEVGQGGMSVVYKGMDTTLHREVAVKVLHPHLASHEEARRRFEREAQAVAKLRHENILEIFDYSGKSSAESYIVTEFINGRTLKEFTTGHKLAFPEIGAMVVAEVCRALAHAHAGGVLHRDVKPENIMIRNDGVVKLTDFGIAQIVDAQRMTVTGQLLGSPAYMSPEHVEGRPLDFRTDVFSVGILLYQLSTGELPFKGRNPHEILKRIAECKYLDARVVNPLVGERLGRIIARALAREPDDRYPDVAPMLDDLLRYLAEADLGEPRAELSRFFAQAVPYEQALRQRLISALTRRGKGELEARRVNAALELFNRVLTIDPANEDVLREIDRLSRKRRLARGVVLAAALAAVVGSVATVKLMWPRSHADDRPRGTIASVADAGVPIVNVAPPDAAPVVRGQPADAAAAIVDPLPIDAGTRVVRPDRPDRPTLARPDAGAAVVVTPGTTWKFSFNTLPQRASYRVDGGEFIECKGGSTVLTLSPGPHRLVVRNEACCFDEELTIVESEPTRTIRLRFKPTQVIPRCPEAKAITVNDRPVESGTHLDITNFDSATGRRKVVVIFLIGEETQRKEVTARAGQPAEEVRCDLP